MAALDKVYLHDKNLVYPKASNEHMMKLPKKHDFVYDEKFEYRQRGFWHLLRRKLLHIVMFIAAFPVCRIRYAVKIKGKRHIKEYKNIVKYNGSKGFLSVCNHTIPWDYIIILMSRHKFNEFPMWKEGAESGSGELYRTVGGIVLPKGEPAGMLYAYKEMENVLNENKWLHIYPEASSWPFYPAVRDFELGAFKIAYEHNLPVLPMGLVFRPNKGIYKIFKKHPNCELKIGKPQQIDKSLPKNEAIKELCDKTRLEVIKLLGISSVEENEQIRKEIAALHE